MKDTESGLEAVIAPVEAARGLPNAHYISEETFEEERRALFFDGWAGVGFAKDTPETGDARPVEFLGVPLLVLRDKEGAIRVFQNVCRHRGMILVSEPKRIEGAIRCPYHSWCYALDGSLKATPHVGGPGQNTHPAVKKSELGLLEVRSHVWRDIVFVNLSGDAPPFETAAADVIERWREFEHPLRGGGARASFTLDVACNWKLAVENYCESYHLPWVHPGLNSYSRLEDHYNIEGPSFSGQGTHVYRQLKGEGGESFPDFPNLSAKWDAAAEYIAVYPNMLLGVHRDHAFAILLEPVAVDRTIEHVELYYPAETDIDGALSALDAANAALWKTVFKEDVFVVEGMQRGRRGDLFDGGRFSPVMDGPTHNFHRWAAERLAARRGAGDAPT